MRVTAAVMEEKSGVFKLDRLELDAPRSDEVLVKIIATGICHTDLHARDGYFAMPYPAVYGHEGAGVVVAVGNAVDHIVAGDHVVISFPWCGECEDAHSHTITVMLPEGTEAARFCPQCSPQVHRHDVETL